MENMCISYLHRYDKTIQISENVKTLLDLISMKMVFKMNGDLDRYLLELTNNQLIRLYRDLKTSNNVIYSNFECNDIQSEILDVFSKIEEQIRNRHLYPNRFDTNYNDDLKLFYLGNICESFMRDNFFNIDNEQNIVIVCDKKEKFNIEFLANYISKIKEKSIIVLGKSHKLWKNELKKCNKEILYRGNLPEKKDNYDITDLKQWFVKNQTIVFYDDEDLIADLLLELEIYPFRRCLVGNIIGAHGHGENKEIVYGTRIFSSGTKVIIAPAQWGDGFENLVVIGKKRNSKEVIEVVQKRRYIENFRFKRVYNPKIIKLMNNSKYSWWGNTLEDEKFLKEFAEHLNSNYQSNHGI